MAELLGYSHKGWPSEYLELPLGGSPWNKGSWESVLDKYRKRLASWRLTTFPLGLESP